MKRMILASLISLLSSDALASDLTYGGPYSQMKVKLCSDTSPSRSILPDGSLICDDNPPTSDTYCTGGFVYADSDIFNCGPAPTSTDLNGNGVDDDYEDWDGDGLANGQDPDPFDNGMRHLDQNHDGIPDAIEDVYDQLLDVQKVLYCESDDHECQNMRSVMNSLASSNSILARVARDASLRNVGRNDFNSSIGALTQSVNYKTSNILDAINNIDIDVTGGVDNTDLLVENFNGLSNRLHSVDKSVESVQYSVNSLFNSFNGIHQHMDLNKSNIVDAINNNDSSVDLSGVETSIDALSDKIDGIEGGNNGEELAEISGKLDGLATGVTDIGDLLKGVDASKAGIDGTCIQGDTCQGFYKSGYEGDLSDVVTAQLDAMKTSIVDPFVSSFGNIDLSGAQRPKFGLPVPFYGYMSFDDYIDMDWIFGFLRFIFLASTAFYCRQIIFGG
ncbi:hypothetical protein [Vibrio cyclitrophicus]|uniref:hypothetical protein n=1 Tax=Vibrio cyclitrophicus TaxID=47951 RepID=UPI0003167AFE|nr:hypothetical protein [Vibrio cyclitrophicus]OEF28997.1 hypothetical protein OA9_10420 [Vibrio cyclitrophicus 1F97]